MAWKRGRPNKTQSDPNLQPAIAGHGSGAGKDMLRRLESLEDELTGSMSYTGSARWMIPYADLITILLGLFLVMFSLSNMDNLSMEAYAGQIQETLTRKNEEITRRNAELEKLRERLVALENLDVTLFASGAALDVSFAGDLSLPAEKSQTSAEAMAVGGVMGGDLPEGISTNGINVTQEKRGLVITLMDSVLFESGSADLSGGSRQTLDQVAEILKDLPHPIRVEGHTDNTPIATGRFPSNWELSTARATNIVRYFIEGHDFDPSRLTAAGYGEYHPVAPNSSIKGKQKNRRVDIVVLNNQAAQLEPRAVVRENPAFGEALEDREIAGSLQGM